MLLAPPLFRSFSRLCFFVVFLLLLGSLLTALWDPLCSFWHPSGSYWDPLGALLAHIGTVLVPFRARFGLFCTLGGLLLARFGRNSIFKAEICKKNTPALTLVLNFLQIFACKLSSLGPGAELLPQATEIRPRAVCGPPQGRVGIGSQSACSLPACTLSPQ